MAFTIASLGRPNYEPNMTCPQIRPAGVVTAVQETAKDALTWNTDQRPATPQEQRKYRALRVHEPGKIARHYGAADDPLPEGPFGAHSREDESVAGLMKGAYPTTDMGRWALEQSEALYASSKREPLGHGFKRGTCIPAGLGTDKPFGMTIDARGKEKARQALHIMFPTDAAPEPEEGTPAHDLYVRSHGAYFPGEQRRRGYDWEQAGVDPTTYRFGATDKDNYREGVRKALQPGLDQTLQQPAVLESKVLADHKLAHTDQLGQVRKLGGGDRGLGPDFVYGRPSLKNGQREPSMAELLQTGTPAEQLQPDADLGKSLREGWRNIAPEERVFGVPSIRTDIPMPDKRSVSSIVNYGNEPRAIHLLRPPHSVDRGVHEDHYMQLRTKDEVKELLEEAGIQLSGDDFDGVFNMAASADGEEEKCCLDTMFRARHHVLGQTLQIRGGGL